MAEEIGVAYLSVKPKMDGSFDSEVKSAGGNAGTGFGGAFQVAAGNLIANAVTSMATAAVDVFKNAFDNYANFEQLSGGVEKIFDQADIQGIMRDAQNAYVDLNMSANEYLESINKTGAAFAQTMGDQKGYDVARTGMKAISDYASGTGRNLDELNEKYAMITRATSSYQSIADQFSGILPATSADFLAQAQAAGFLSGEYKKLTDVPVAEYQEAVSKMLEKGVADMGLAGNTAMESTKTISGSLSMLSSSWQNFLTGLFDDNAQLDELAYNLMDSVGAVLANIAPRITTLASRLFMELPNGLITVIDAIPAMLEPVIMGVFGDALGEQILQATKDACWGFTDTMEQLGGSLMELFQAVLETLRPVVETVINIISAAMPIIQQAIGIVVSFVTDNVIPLITEVLTIIQPVIEQITGLINEHMPQIQGIIQNAMGIIQQVIQTVWPIVKGVITTVVSAISSFMQAAWPVISGIVDTAMNAIESAINGVSYIVGVVQGIFNGVRHAIEDPIGAARDFIGGAIDAIRNFFNFSIQWPHIPMPHPYISPYGWHLGQLLEGVIPSIGIDWYAKGGMVDDATLIGAGERGAELIWPSYDPYLSKYADAIADRMDNRGVEIHDCTFNVRDDDDIKRIGYEINLMVNRQLAGGLA